MKKLTSQLTLAVVCGLLGFMLTYQFKLLNKEEQNKAANTNYNSTEITAEIDALTKSKQDLEKKNDQLTAQIKKYEDTASNNDSVAKELKDQLDESRVLLGETDVEGPGVVLYLTPKNNLFSSNSSVPQYLDHRELTYLVNELNFAGAEAISINDQRVTSQTGMKLSGNGYILINGEKVSPNAQIAIKAIGDKVKLEQSLKFVGVFNYLNLEFYTPEITTSDSIVIPKFDKIYNYSYIKPVKD